MKIICSEMKMEISTHTLTPSDEGEAPQVFCVREEGHENETMEVQALH